jgi:hypothetical protein
MTLIDNPRVKSHPLGKYVSEKDGVITVDCRCGGAPVAIVVNGVAFFPPEHHVPQDLALANLREMGLVDENAPENGIGSQSTPGSDDDLSNLLGDLLGASLGGMPVTVIPIGFGDDSFGELFGNGAYSDVPRDDNQATPAEHTHHDDAPRRRRRWPRG